MVNQGHKTTFFTFLLPSVAAWGKMRPQGYFYTQQTPTLVTTRRGAAESSCMCLGGKGTNNMQYPETITEGQTRPLNLTTPTLEFL